MGWRTDGRVGGRVLMRDCGRIGHGKSRGGEERTGGKRSRLPRSRSVLASQPVEGASEMAILPCLCFHVPATPLILLSPSPLSAFPTSTTAVSCIIGRRRRPTNQQLANPLTDLLPSFLHSCGWPGMRKVKIHPLRIPHFILFCPTHSFLPSLLLATIFPIFAVSEGKLMDR